MDSSNCMALKIKEKGGGPKQTGGTHLSTTVSRTQIQIGLFHSLEIEIFKLFFIISDPLDITQIFKL